MRSMAQPAADNRSLQELAVDVVQDIHKLATGLAHAGAPPNVTKQIEQTSELYAGISKALASGPVGQQTAGGQPAPMPGGAVAPGGQATAPPAPPSPSPGAQVPGPGTPMAQAPAQGDLHNAIAQMHHDAVNAAVRSAGTR